MGGHHVVVATRAEVGGHVDNMYALCPHNPLPENQQGKRSIAPVLLTNG